MSIITRIKAREILDSRGNPTVETTITLDDKTRQTASVPSGASIGKYEAVELRDSDETRFRGMGVLRAVDNVNKVIAPKIIGLDPVKQQEIDELMINLDSTPNKRNLGANAILSVSTCLAKSAAASAGIPLYSYLHQYAKTCCGSDIVVRRMPTPIFNMIIGGKNGGGNLDFQEFNIAPATNKNFHESVQIGAEIYRELRTLLTYRNISHSQGDEGGYTPNLSTNLDAIIGISDAIKQTRYRLDYDVFLALDLATAFFKHGSNYLIRDLPEPLSREAFIEYISKLNTQYHILILEDPLDEDDWQGWARLTSLIAGSTIITGDDLIATNPERLKMAVKEKACNAVLLKPNQIGTITETVRVASMARNSDLKIIMSHRSGETTDSFIADLAVALQADYVKFGSPARGERVVKYNRLLEIEEELPQ